MQGEPIGRLAVVTSVDNTELARGFRESEKLTVDFYRHLHGRIGAPTAAEGSLKRITNDLRQADAHAKSFGFSMRNAIVGGLVSGGTAAAAMVGGELLSQLGGGIGDIVKESVNLAASMEVSALSMEGLAGSAEKARDLMKELRQYAKESPLSYRQGSGLAENLLANGIRPDQVLPTIQVLSDISRGDPLKMQRLQLALVQSRAKGHLAGQELNQFAETGVPIEDQLAKNLGKSKGEIRGLVEEGRVGYSDVQRALRDMTEEGGAFYKQTERYAESLSGKFDSLRDSVEMAKAAFGAVIVEEVGLKDAARDAGAFADRVKDIANEARPAIRFVGDVAKAGVQLAYLGGRMTAVFGGEGLRVIMERFPAVGRTVEMIRDGLRDFQDMKVDDAKVRDFANGMANAISDSFDELMKSDTFKSFEKRWKDGIIDPLEKGLAGFKEAAEDYRSAKDLGRLATPKGQAEWLFGKWAQNQLPPLNPKPQDDDLRGLALKRKPDDPFYDPKFDGPDPAPANPGTGGFLAGLFGSKDPMRPTSESRGAILGGMGTDAFAKSVAEGQRRKFEIEQGRNDQLMNKYKPESQKFSDSLSELQKALAEKAIDDRVYTLALGDLVRGATGTMAAKLPQGIEYGSQELAAAIAKANAGTPTMSMEQILTQMKATEEQHYQSSLRIEKALSVTPPTVVGMPQK